MERYIYTAMTGALHTLTAQRIHANNLANVNTTGFRADFERAESYQVDGPGYASRYLALSEAAGSDFSMGRLEQTGRSLDVGFRGAGFIAVQIAEGQEAYTRSGSLQLDDDGMLTVNGYPVSGDGGPLQIPEYRQISIGEDGTITIVPNEGNATLEVGRIKLVNPALNELAKGRNGLFHLAEGGVAGVDETVRLVAEHLEGSNVNAVDEMVDTMSLSRTFEVQVRMMKTADELSAAGSRLVRGA